MVSRTLPAINWDKAGLGDRLDSEVARDLNVPRRRVAKERARRGIEAYSKRARNAVAKKPATAHTPAIAPDPFATTSVVVNQQPTPVTHIVANSPVLTPPPAPPKPEKKPKLKNYIAVVLDDSGSMQSNQIHVLVRDSYNQLIDTIKKSAADTGQETVFSLFKFGTRITHDVIDCPIEKVKHLTDRTYYPNQGNTALLDGVGAAIGYLKDRPDAGDENVSHLVVVLTDGLENASRTFRPDDIYATDKRCTKLLKLITEIQYAGNWTLTFQLPPGYKDQFAQTYKIPGDNIREWEQTDRGVRETFEKTSAGINTYFTARASGQKSVQSFYTDLSKLKTSEIKKKLDDISDRFKEYTVDKEASVKEFVESKTKKPFVIGAAYYLLMKKEEIQPHKKVLIREKTKRAVWGGDAARDLIGLPNGVTAKVTPGNHSNYDIFVQSKSVNRILPRGTVVLVDVSKTTNDAPTWDHTKVNQNS